MRLHHCHHDTTTPPPEHHHLPTSSFRLPCDPSRVPDRFALGLGAITKEAERRGERERERERGRGLEKISDGSCVFSPRMHPYSWCFVFYRSVLISYHIALLLSGSSDLHPPHPPSDTPPSIVFGLPAHDDDFLFLCETVASRVLRSSFFDSVWFLPATYQEYCSEPKPAASILAAGQMSRDRISRRIR